MLLELRKILTNPGASVPFETSLDLYEMAFGSCCPLTEPVVVSGPVRNTAGVLELKGEVRTTLHAVCDRCASAFEREVCYPVEAVLVSDEVTDSYENPWVFELVDGCADLDDIVTTVLVLNMPSQLLCKPDCKGLCCKCGKNLNDGPCDCQKDVDPRLEALLQLLDEVIILHQGL